MTKESESRKGRGIYLLPNIFTTAGMFAAFYAIVAAMDAHFQVAVVAIFISIVADTLDGRVARLTNTQSDFGAQYDSLADMMSFGVAPALVIFSWGLHDLGKLGWLIAFVYTAATALRLARFNLQTTSDDKRYFHGLPCPSAAAILAAYVWLCTDNLLQAQALNIIALLLTFLVSFLMVSNISYYSFKDLDLKGRVPFIAVLLVVLVFVGVSVNPPFVLFASFFVYAMSGPVLTFWRWQQKRRRKK